MRDVVRPAIAVKCPKKGIKYVVNEDGTIGDYIELIEPAAVDDDATFAEKTIYKNRRTIYDKLEAEYDQDKLQATIEIWELFGPDSKERLRDYSLNPDPGFDAVDLEELLKTVLRTHMNDRYDDVDIKSDGKRDTFANMKMLREESFYSRWKLNEQMYRTCLIDEDPANEEILIGNQFTLVKRFLMSLDQYRFGDQENKYRNGDRDWTYCIPTM